MPKVQLIADTPSQGLTINELPPDIIVEIGAKLDVKSFLTFFTTNTRLNSFLDDKGFWTGLKQSNDNNFLWENAFKDELDVIKERFTEEKIFMARLEKLIEEDQTIENLSPFYLKVLDENGLSSTRIYLQLLKDRDLKQIQDVLAKTEEWRTAKSKALCIPLSATFLLALIIVIVLVSTDHVGAASGVGVGSAFVGPCVTIGTYMGVIKCINDRQQDNLATVKMKKIVLNSVVVEGTKQADEKNSIEYTENSPLLTSSALVPFPQTKNSNQATLFADQSTSSSSDKAEIMDSPRNR